MRVLEAESLRKTYGRLVAVEALDLAVAQGEIFGLLGPNGAGKTTAISMMCGVMRAEAGRVRIGGHDIVKEPFAARRLLGLAPQELALYEDLTGRENLHFLARLQGLRGAARHRAVAWALEVAGLEERAGDLAGRYSSGMKRRLNLAAGILHRPRLLVLDEPTVGVDAQSRAYIFETVRTLQADEGMTVLYTSHYMEEVQALCSRVAIMDRGHLVAQDTVDGLIAAHAAPGMEITLEGDAAAAEEALRDLGAVAREGCVLHLEASPGAGEVVGRVERSGCRLLALGVRRADLETVFLRLTGRSLRDGS